MNAHWFFLPWIWLWVLLISSANSVSAESSPAFWRIDGKQGDGKKASVYLLGSMHFGHPSFFPLPKVIERAFDESTVLAVEVDVTRIDAARAEQALMQYGQLPRGQSLRSLLSASTYKQLTEACSRKKLPVSAFERFQPWFAALQLVLSEIRASPLDQSLGLDLHFLKRADHHRIDELESFESQLKLSAEASFADQEALLSRTLDDLANSQDYLMTLASAWQQGDLETLQSSLVEPFQADPMTQSLYRTMFITRNAAMTKAVETYLKSGETVFVVVGAGHLIGSDGLIARLKQLGYSVERVN